MKKCVTLLAILSLMSCQSKKDSASVEMAKPMITGACPESGTCKLTYLKNKSLKFTNNDATGKPYHTIVDSDTKNVIQYEYTMKVDTTLADNGHTEVILFEVNAANPEVELSGVDLQQSNMTFGRFCFCRGQTGIYKVTDGKLSIKKDKDNLKVDLNFKITEVPQILNSFSAIIK